MSIEPDPLQRLPLLLEVHTVAYRINRSQEFVRRLIRTHKLPAHRIGAHWCVDAKDLAAYIDGCRTTGNGNGNGHPPREGDEA